MVDWSVSIPQAVSTVATYFVDILIIAPSLVSIPQAVSTVATGEFGIVYFNVNKVSIPQAVSTVATAGLTKPVFMGLKNRFWKTSHRKRSKRAPI